MVFILCVLNICCTRAIWNIWKQYYSCTCNSSIQYQNPTLLRHKINSCRWNLFTFSVGAPLYLGAGSTHVQSQYTSNTRNLDHDPAHWEVGRNDINPYLRNFYRKIKLFPYNFLAFFFRKIRLLTRQTSSKRSRLHNWFSKLNFMKGLP